MLSTLKNWTHFLKSVLQPDFSCCGKKKREHGTMLSEGKELRFTLFSASVFASNETRTVTKQCSCIKLAEKDVPNSETELCQIPV